MNAAVDDMDMDTNEGRAAEGGALVEQREARPLAPLAPAQTEGVAPLVMLLASGQLKAEHVEQAMALQEQQDTYRAKQAYHRDMRAFRSSVGAAKRTGRNTHLRSSYATLDDVIEAVSGPLANAGEGFNYDFDIEQTADEVRTTCTITHAQGFARSTSFTAPIDKSAKGINAVQQIGIATTYGKRYTLSALTGVATEDSDGEAPPTAAPPVLASDEQVSQIVALVDAIDELSDGFADRWKRSKADDYAAAENPLGLAVPAAHVERIRSGLAKRLETARAEASS